VIQLSHVTEDCPGQWQRVEAAAAPLEWRCSACGACYHDGVEVRFAVLREYDLELVLGRLVREGRRMLGGPPGQ
jgi:hypothetical protein